VGGLGASLGSSLASVGVLSSFVSDSLGGGGAGSVERLSYARTELMEMGLTVSSLTGLNDKQVLSNSNCFLFVSQQFNNLSRLRGVD
jgi:hypothetical protein